MSCLLWECDPAFPVLLLYVLGLLIDLGSNQPQLHVDALCTSQQPLANSRFVNVMP